jgi:toxin ParE1/3/4
LQICKTFALTIANEDPDAAQRVGEDILKHVEVLATFPFIGPKYFRSSSDRVREIVCRSYRIFYRVTEERALVEVLTIWHGARGTPTIPV